MAIRRSPCVAILPLNSIRSDGSASNKARSRASYDAGMKTVAQVARVIAALAAILVAGCASMPQPTVVPPAALRLEGVPALPSSLLAATQRYADVAGHGFVDWHPTQREMLVAHRAPGASTTQLWRLRSPLAALEPLTDGSDPVSSAKWEPRDGRYIVFARGSGGDEAFALYRLDPETRAVTQITPPGQRHGLQGWIKSRSLALVTSVPLDRTASGGSRAEVSTTLSIIDPLNPADRKVLAELPGGGWFDAEVAPDERQLAITRYISATESEVWLIDLTNGQRRQLLPAPGEAVKVSHFVGSWSADGRSLYIASDRGATVDRCWRTCSV